jgi:hypothetical protein
VIVGEHAVTSVAYDPSAQFLAYSSGNGVSVLGVKDLAALLSLPGAHSKACSQVCWAADSASLFSCGMDRAVKQYSA